MVLYIKLFINPNNNNKLQNIVLSESHPGPCTLFPVLQGMKYNPVAIIPYKTRQVSYHEKYTLYNYLKFHFIVCMSVLVRVRKFRNYILGLQNTL